MQEVNVKAAKIQSDSKHILKLEIISRSIGGVFMEKIAKQPKVSRGIFVFFLAVIGFIVIAAPMQFFWGLWGLALTELLFIIISVLAVKTWKWDFKEVFSIKKPKMNELGAVLVSWLGTVSGMLIINNIILYLFPVAMSQTEGSLNEFFMTLPLPLSLFIVAVMPAIGEEILFRGAIQYNFREQSKWVTILSVGFLFGLFHIDPTRILGTTLLGIVAAYIMYETQNLLLPILLHLINNAFGVSGVFLFDQVAPHTVANPVQELSSVLLVGFTAPLLILAGTRMFKSRQHRLSVPISGKTWAVTIVLTITILAGGLLLPELVDFKPIFWVNFFQESLTENLDSSHLFSIEKDGQYMLKLAATSEEVHTSVIVIDSSGQEVYNLAGNNLRDSGRILLDADQYELAITFDYDVENKSSLKFDFLIY